MILPPLTFMIDPIMNLMNRPHHKYEKKKNIILRILELPQNYSNSYWGLHWLLIYLTPKEVRLLVAKSVQKSFIYSK